MILIFLLEMPECLFLSFVIIAANTRINGSLKQNFFFFFTFLVKYFVV